VCSCARGNVGYKECRKVNGRSEIMHKSHVLKGNLSVHVRVEIYFEGKSDNERTLN